MKVPAAELVASGRCYPICLLAGDGDARGKCRCRCGGEFHGALADALVETDRAKHWWDEHLRCGRSLDVCVVERRGHRSRPFSDGEPRCYVRDAGSEYSVVWDGITLCMRDGEIRASWPAREAELLNRLVLALLKLGRARMVGQAPASYFSVLGLRHLDEARTLALIVEDCFAGDSALAMRAIEALEESAV